MEESAEKDIVRKAAAAGSFTMPVTALKGDGMVEALSGEGPYAVFGPTDEAFAEFSRAPETSSWPTRKPWPRCRLFMSFPDKSRPKLSSKSTPPGDPAIIRWQGQALYPESRRMPFDPGIHGGERFGFFAACFFGGLHRVG